MLLRLGLARRRRAAIRDIYNLEVETSMATFDLVPRSLDDQRAWLAARSGAFAAIVAVDGDGVIGFAALSPYKERAAYRTSVEDSVYVRRDCQGLGVGRALLSHVVGRGRGQRLPHGHRPHRGRRCRVAERCTPPAASSWSASSGEVGRKFNRWLDVAIMQHLLSDSEQGRAGRPGPPPSSG